MTKDEGIFFSCSFFAITDELHIGNGMGLDIHHIGLVLLSTLSAAPLYLNNVLHVPTITKNLLTVFKLLEDNNVLNEFHSTTCFVKAKTLGTILLKGITRGRLYQVESLAAISNHEVSNSPGNQSLHVLSVTSKFVSGHSHYPVSMISHLVVSGFI